MRALVTGYLREIRRASYGHGFPACIQPGRVNRIEDSFPTNDCYSRSTRSPATPLTDLEGGEVGTPYCDTTNIICRMSSAWIRCHQSIKIARVGSVAFMCRPRVHSRTFLRRTRSRTCETRSVREGNTLFRRFGQWNPNLRRSQSLRPASQPRSTSCARIPRSVHCFS